ncbi:MAG: FAD-binding oxidoreductase [Steroidobacteraceae bacterium]|nr:FAD-binding oxidoreductase [Steroidobacteraceae bacterium]
MKRREFVSRSLALVAATGLASPRWARATESVDVPAVSRIGGAVVLKAADIADFRARLSGPVLTRTSEGYDVARRIWNGAFDRHPALIARCANAADVTSAVQFAAHHDLLVAIRGGGHSLPGLSVCESGIMIDLALMKSVRVDAKTRDVHVEPGVLLGAMDRETQALGLVVPAGTVSHTGVAGLTLGGGVGRLQRKFGLTVDCLVGADVVTAAGKLVQANARENPDLLWALQGGGGNFGVVTSFEYRAFEFGRTAVAGGIVFPIEQARGVLDAFANYCETASDELWMDPVLECDAAGLRQLNFTLCHCGNSANAAKDVAAIRKFGKVVRDTVAEKSWVDIQSEFDRDSPHGRSYYMSGGRITRLIPAMLDHAVVSIKLPGAELGKISLTQQGGASARRPTASTAYASRDASHNFVVRAAWDDPKQATVRTGWQKETWKGFAPYSVGLYANLNAAEANVRARSAYGENLERLVEVKTQYDPKNLFHLNPNITPRAARID